MDDFDRTMTAAEWITLREYLGLTGPWMLHTLHIVERTLRRWEADESPIPTDAAGLLWALEDRAGVLLDELVGHLRTLTQPGLILFRTDDAYTQRITSAYPARWHRQFAARALDRVPGLRITFFADDQLRANPLNWTIFAAGGLASQITAYEQPTQQARRS